MLRRDSEGYLVESSSPQHQSGRPGRGTHQRVLDFVQEQRQHQRQRRQARTKNSSAVAIVRTQEALGNFYCQLVALVETHLLTKATIRFLSKYLLYPFLSGAFSATLSLYRSAGRR